MLISNLFVRHKTPPPRFAPGFFLFLLIVFTALGQVKPIFGLVGLGTTLVITATLVEINRNRIWEMYKKTYKKNAGLLGMWTKPNPVYYNINVIFLWPFIFFLGLICLWAAYVVS